MTNADKAELRWIMKNEPDAWTDEKAALAISAREDQPRLRRRNRMPHIAGRDLRDLLDLATIAHDSGLVARCPGGRPVISGHCCNLCGRDTSIPGQTCGAPLNADGSASKSIPKEVDDD